jgi:hypothetical protein
MPRIEPGSRIVWRLVWCPAVLAGLSCAPVAVETPSRASQPPAAGPEARALRQESDKGVGEIILQDFNGGSVPVNRAGETYPSQYRGSGTAGVRLDPGDAVKGNSLRFDVTSGGFYAQFNPYGQSDRGFARDYSTAAARWRFNTYNRLSLWVQRPATSSALRTNGSQNVQVGTFVKRVADADRSSDEAGGGHYYHLLNLPNSGCWSRVILNMHPDHQRGNSGGVDPGVLAHPTGETRYNYFDALTRFYIDDSSSTRAGTYRIDEVRFYQETARENDAQVFSMTGTYDPVRGRLIVTWNRPKDENDTKHEVRYSFTDVHRTGWQAATPAPRGLITPPGWQGYNGMVYDTTALPLAGHPVVYIAVKPQNSDLFSQIAVPLAEGGHRR